MNSWTRRAFAGFAVTIAVTGAIVGPAAMGTYIGRDAVLATIELWRQEAPGMVTQLLGAVRDVVITGYARTPETMLAVGLALALPIIGTMAGLVRWINSQRTAHRMQAGAAPAVPAMGLLASPHAKAWLEVARQTGPTLRALQGEICRIGSGRDNDVELSGPAMQPAHALIRRTPDAEFLIIDITGEAGPGITVNGDRFLRCALRDGDRINLGGAEVTFRRERERIDREPRTEPPQPALH